MSLSGYGIYKDGVCKNFYVPPETGIVFIVAGIIMFCFDMKRYINLYKNNQDDDDEPTWPGTGV